MSPWKWLAFGTLLVLVSLLLATSIGTRRGTRLYRLRVRMWTAALALASAGGLVLSSPGCRGKDDDRPMCYDTVMVRDAGTDEEQAGMESVQGVQNATDAANVGDGEADHGGAVEEARSGKKGEAAGKNRGKKPRKDLIYCYFPAD